MKKLLVYLAIPIVLSGMQACNGNPASDKSTANDSMVNGSASNDSATQQNADSANTDTSQKKNAKKIDASKVPAAVVTAFNTKYPNVANVKWVQADKKGKTLYRARWEANGKQMMAAFAEDGSFIKEKQLN